MPLKLNQALKRPHTSETAEIGPPPHQRQAYHLRRRRSSQRHTRPRTDGGNPALAQIVQNAARVALEGRAMSTAASRMRHGKFAGLECYAVARRQGSKRAITPSLLGLSERAAAAAPRAHRAIDCPIGCVEHLRRVNLRSDQTHRRLRGPLGMCPRPRCPRQRHGARRASDDPVHPLPRNRSGTCWRCQHGYGEECVRDRRRGSPDDADLHLVDKWRTLVARILTGNHSCARRLDGAGLGLTETGRDFRQRSLHRVGHPVDQVRRREGAGKGMAWSADRAILSAPSA
jgi:hypothetical protein